MTHEHLQPPAPKRPYEQFGFTEQEFLFNRVSNERFEQILDDPKSNVHKIGPSSNDFGEFLFVTVSRPGARERIGMTFYGLGYHEQRERWITNEWFWYQSEPLPGRLNERVEKDDAHVILNDRRAEIVPLVGENTQSSRGKIFELLADLTDEDGALAEMEDLDSLGDWMAVVERSMPLPEPSPTGEYLLDDASKEKLPSLGGEDEKGMDALAQVKFFTPDSDWTWYASEYDGQDIFFGLVSGFEVELGYFSLKELQETRGPLGLQIERDLHFEPKSLRELYDQHWQELHPE